MRPIGPIRPILFLASIALAILVSTPGCAILGNRHDSPQDSWVTEWNYDSATGRFTPTRTRP